MKPRDGSEYANGEARGFVRIGSVERSRGCNAYGHSIRATWIAAWTNARVSRSAIA
jgi:hypothetical protein